MTRHLQDRLMRFLTQRRDELLGFVRSLSHSAEEAEDIVQEAAARTLAGGEQIRAPETYLFVVARNLSREKQGESRRTASEPTRVEGLAPSAEDEAIAREASDALRRAVAQLPPQCRSAFALQVFHGCSYQEIADRLGISIKTVEKHISRGLRDTRKSMQAHARTISATRGLTP